MKNLKLTVLLAVLALVGCSQKKPAEASAGDGALTAAGSGASVSAVSGNAGYGWSLRVGTSFLSPLDFTSNTEADTLKWGKALPLGERVAIISAEPRKLTYSSDKKVYDFINIRTVDGEDGYVWDTQIAIGGELGVVVGDKTNIYRSAKSIDVTGNFISRKTVLVHFPDTASGDFVQFKAYDIEKKGYIQGYVRTDSFSKRDVDIQSAILLLTAEAENTSTQAGENRRKALLEIIVRDYITSFLFTEVNALLNPPAESEDTPLLENNANEEESVG